MHIISRRKIFLKMHDVWVALAPRLEFYFVHIPRIGTNELACVDVLHGVLDSRLPVLNE